MIINEVNDLLKPKCLVKSFHFINQINGWTLNNGALDFSLFLSGGLHLVEKGNLKLDKSILKAIDSNSNANSYKNSVCFNLNECDFPPLPSSKTRCKLVYSPVKYVGPVRKPIRRVFKSFAQGYEPFCSTVLPVCSAPVSVFHSSLYQPVVTSVPYMSPVRIPTAIFPSYIPNICYTNASIRSFSSKLKTTSTLKSSLSSHQRYTPTSTSKSPYSSDLQSISSSPVTTLTISSHRTSDRATLVPRSILSSITVDSSVNSSNSSYIARVKPLSFETTKSLVPKPLASALTLLLVEQFLVEQFLIQQILHSPMLHLCIILFLILSK